MDSDYPEYGCWVYGIDPIDYYEIIAQKSASTEPSDRCLVARALQYKALHHCSLDQCDEEAAVFTELAKRYESDEDPLLRGRAILALGHRVLISEEFATQREITEAKRALSDVRATVDDSILKALAVSASADLAELLGL